MRAYDCIIIIKPNLGEEATQALIENIKGWVTNNEGEIISSKAIGNRELAYPINKMTHGYYFHMHFLGNNAVLEEIRSRIMVSEDIVRDLIVRLDSIMTKSEVAAVVARRGLVAEPVTETAPE